MNVAAEVGIKQNPFPGLRPFREDEEYLFFGRENQVDAMVDKLAATRFLAVVGTSGSGKSSLVNCGLRPALRTGLMARAGTAWRMAQFRPGSDPMGAMARALAADGVLFSDYQAGGLSLADIVDTTLRMSSLGLIDIFEQAHLEKGANLLVVVDQFEELFRYWQIETSQPASLHSVKEQATAFVNLLLEAAKQSTYPIYVVLTMRSDFLGDCTQFRGLAEAINAGQYLVPRMTREERRAAISGPVGVAGAAISPVLLTRLVNDVGDNPDQLSILQHALNRTWAYWQHESVGDRQLDLAHYKAIGSMAHALDQHAEKAYDELATVRQEKICEKIFKALTDKATDPRGIRRPTTLGTLCTLAHATETEINEVIDVFRRPSRSFLMPPAGEALEAQTVIDISHESLMRVWKRLNNWADEEALSAARFSRLADTAALHAKGQASLWRDPDLQLALDWRDRYQPNETWASRYHPGFSQAMSFLSQSREAREAELAAQEEKSRREREAEEDQRRREVEAAQEKAEFQSQYARRMRRVALFSIAVAVFAMALPTAFIVWTAKKGLRAGSGLTALARHVGITGDFPLPEMMPIDGGSFMMGSPDEDEDGQGDADERPQHKVNVPAFMIGKTEVTFSEYDHFAQATTGHSLPSDEGWGRETRPVINVSWDDAVAYTEWLSVMTGKDYRLPTEAEWEYAARAETTTLYWWGNDMKKEDGKPWANYRPWRSDGDGVKTEPVKSFAENPWGLHDTAGNVYEWVQDCDTNSYKNAPVDGSPYEDPDCGQRVLRGGSWSSKPVSVRSANRHRLNRDKRDTYIGFRVAQDCLRSTSANPESSVCITGAGH